MNVLPRGLPAAVLILSSVFAIGGEAPPAALPSAPAKAPPAVKAAPAPVSYHREIRPIFQETCQGCHQPAKPLGKFVITTHAGLIDAESRKPAVVPGKPDESLLVRMITSQGGNPPKMPKDHDPLAKPQVDLIRRWIQEGAADDTPEAARDRFNPGRPQEYTRPPVLTSLAYSADGTLLAVPAYHEILLHKADGSGLVARLVGLSERIESVVFSPDGKYLAAAGGSPVQMGELQVWEVETRKLKLALPVGYDTIRGASWAPDGSLVAFGCSDNSVRAVEALTGKQVFFQGAPPDWVLATAFSTDGSHLVTVGRDGSMKLMQVKTQQFIDDITSITPGALKGGLQTVDRHPKKDELLIGGSDGVPKIYQMYRTKARVIGDDFNKIREFEAVTGRIFSARYSKDGEKVAVGSSLDGGGEVRLYQAGDGKLLWKLDAQGAVYAVAFSPDGTTVAAGGFDGQVRLISAGTGKVVKEFVPVPISTEGIAGKPGDAPAGGANVILASVSTPGSPAPTEPSNESLPAGAKLASIEISPPSVEIADPFGYRQVIVTGVLEGGDRVDVTRMAKAEAPAAVEISHSGQIRPRADGQGDLKFTVEGKTASVPVKVSGLGAKREISFVNDVMPLLSRAGCNAGTCHGAAKGRNGFKLSLRGYDALWDHRTLTDDLACRRTNRAVAERSLFILKPSGGVPHTGGVLFHPGEPNYEVLRSWVAQGAKLDLKTPKVDHLEILPKDPILPMPGNAQQMAVMAVFADGKVRDVTAEAFVETSNTEVVQVDRRAVVTAIRRGETGILARYEGRYAATQLFVMGDRKGFAWKAPKEYNYIDTLVYTKLQKIKALPSEVASDADFLRRIWLDLTGLPPRPADVRAFLLDTRDSHLKRDEVVDRLIGSSEFVEHWTSKWCDLLQVNRKFLGVEGAEALRGWIRQAVASNTPYDRFVESILDGSGSTLKNPPAAYYKVLRHPSEVMENTTQLFLGVRFSCAKCHDHPFERWTNKNYWQLSAFWARVDRKNVPGSPMLPQRGDNQPEDAPSTLEEMISEKDSGELKPAEQGGQVINASFPFTHPGKVPEEGLRRDRLTRWLISAENPYFARSFVNRLWSYFLGKGIIDPVDDIRAGNPPANPQLLDRLTREFVDSGFDVRKVMRDILKSRVYQQSIDTNEWNKDDEVNFSHGMARRLPAETLYDAIHQATGSTVRLPGERRGTLAGELLDPAVKSEDGFLDLFGRPPRESACECERSTGMSLGQALNMVNGPTVADAIRDPANNLVALLQVEKDPRKILDEMFLSILCRYPTEAENREMGKTLDVNDPTSADGLNPPDAKDLVARWAAWEKSERPPSWTPLSLEITKAASGATFKRLDDGSYLLGGTNPDKDSYTLATITDLAGITGIRLEVLADDSLGGKGPGRADNGNFVLQEFRLAAAPAGDPAAVKKAVFQNASQDFAQDGGFTAAAAVDGKPETGWAIVPQTGKRHEGVFETKEDLGAAGGTLLTFNLDQQYGQKHQIGRFRLSVTSSPRPVRMTALPEDIVRILLTPADKRKPEERAVLWRQYIARDPEMADKIRMVAAQDVAWALINSPAFLFNR